MNTAVMKPSTVNSTRLAVPPVLEQYGRGWRWLTVLAGLTVAVTFFIPLTGNRATLPRQTSPTGFTKTVGGPSTLDVPLLFWVDFFQQLRSVPLAWWEGQTDRLTNLIMVGGLPYYWGLMMGLYSLAQLRGHQRARRLIWAAGTWGSLIASALVVAPAVIETVKAISSNPSSSAANFLFFAGIQIGIICAIQVYVLLALRHGPWAYLYHGFVAALLPVMVVVLAAVLAGPKALGLGVNGVTAMMVGLCLLLPGRVGEAKAVSRASWLGTLIGLCLLRLEKRAIPAGHCTVCGYNLTGNVTGVCSECGSAVPG